MARSRKKPAAIAPKPFWERHPALIIAAFALAAYSTSFTGTFQLDDLRNIIQNESIRNIRNLGAIWGFLPRRFIGNLTFALNYHFNGANPFGYHVVNVLIHIAASLALFRLTGLVLKTPRFRNRAIAGNGNAVALGCALLFAVHPIQTQAVTYIVQRLASLATMFYLLSVASYISGRMERGKRSAVMYAAAAVSCLLGMLTKEITFTLPIMILIVEFGLFGSMHIGRARRNPRILVLIGSTAAALLVIPALIGFNWAFIFNTVPSDRLADPRLSPFVYALTQFRVIPLYLRLILAPVGLSVEHDIPAAVSFMSPDIIAGAILVAGLLGFGVWMFFRGRLAGFGLIWFFLAMSVESLKPLANVMYEHRMYLPMAGLSMAAMDGIHALARRTGRKPAAVTFVVIVVMLAGLSVHRNLVWRDPVILWTDAIGKAPNRFRPYSNRADAYRNRGDVVLAFEDIDTAAKLFPNQAKPQYFKAIALNDLGRYEEAVASITRAINIKPNNAELYRWRGLYNANMGKTDEALADIEHAIDLAPNNGSLYQNRAGILLMKGDIAGARADIEHARSLGETIIPALERLIGK